MREQKLIYFFLLPGSLFFLFSAQKSICDHAINTHLREKKVTYLLNEEKEGKKHFKIIKKTNKCSAH